MIATSWAEWVKYNPNWADQPRIPAGQPDGGQWSQGGAGGEGGDTGGGTAPEGEGAKPSPSSTHPEFPPEHTPPPRLHNVADHVPEGTYGRVKKFTWHEDMTAEDVATVEAKVKEAFGAGVSVHDVLSAAGTQEARFDLTPGSHSQRTFTSYLKERGVLKMSWAQWVKYNPNWADQPRVPAGQPEGGQWSQGGSDGGSGGAEGGNGQGTGGDANRPAPGHTTPPTTARDHVPPGTFGHTKNFTWNEDLMTEGDKDEVLKTIKDIFGPHMPVEHVLSLAGTPDGSKVALSASGYGGTKVLTIMHESPELERNPNTYEITKGHEAVRELYVEPDGRMYLHNDLFVGPGKGLDMFGRQVEAATQYGIGHIETSAVGDGDPKTGKADGRFNGYYTWPRFGYDANLDRNQLEKIPDHLKPQVQAAGGRVSGLMATKEGRDWWRGNGSDLQAKFDLTPGSYSQRTFNAYLRERDKVKASWAEWLKYNPNWADQPRVPAGQPEGGQWAGGGEGGPGDTGSDHSGDPAVAGGNPPPPPAPGGGRSRTWGDQAIPDGHLLEHGHIEALGDIQASNLFYKVRLGGQDYFVKQMRPVEWASEEEDYDPERALDHETTLRDASKMLDVRVPPIRATDFQGKPAVVMPFLKDAKSLEDVYAEGKLATTLENVPKQEIGQHLLFSYLMGVSDRHLGNYMVEDNHLVSIDHELSLGDGMWGKQSQQQQARSLIVYNRLYSARDAARDTPLDSDTIRSFNAKAPQLATMLRERGMPEAATTLTYRARILANLHGVSRPTVGHLLDAIDREPA